MSIIDMRPMKERLKEMANITKEIYKKDKAAAKEAAKIKKASFKQRSKAVQKAVLEAIGRSADVTEGVDNEAYHVIVSYGSYETLTYQMMKALADMFGTDEIEVVAETDGGSCSHCDALEVKMQVTVSWITKWPE